VGDNFMFELDRGLTGLSEAEGYSDACQAKKHRAAFCRAGGIVVDRQVGASIDLRHVPPRATADHEQVAVGRFNREARILVVVERVYRLPQLTPRRIRQPVQFDDSPGTFPGHPDPFDCP
jgi:hypothetical protein